MFANHVNQASARIGSHINKALMENGKHEKTFITRPDSDQNCQMALKL